MRLVFPNSHRINRGNYVVKELAEACRANEVTDLIVVHEHRGVPGAFSLVAPELYAFQLSTHLVRSPFLSLPSDALIVSHFPHGPTVYFTLHNVVLRHDIASHSSSTVSEQYPHLLFDGFESKLGQRVMDVLRFLFPVPKEDSKRVMTFANEGDFVTFR